MRTLCFFLCTLAAAALSALDEHMLVCSYDDQERSVCIEACCQGTCHDVVEMQYELADDGSVAHVTTRFPDQTAVEEDRTPSGTIVQRVWKSADGTVVLSEQRMALDAKGSTSVQRQAGDEIRTVEWTVGDHGHLEHVGGIFFQYDAEGRCISKTPSVGPEIRYEWNERGEMTRQYSVDGSVDYRYTFDEHGRICRAFDAVARKTVIRTFDEAGRLVEDGEQAVRVRAVFDTSGSLSLLELPGDTCLCYEGKNISKGGAWTVTISEKEQTTSDGGDPARTEIEYCDPLGMWQERFSYDVLNQLQREDGEFQETYDFDAFGLSQEARACHHDGDGRIVEKKGMFFGYDALGRLTTVKHGDDEEQYRYDGFGRIQEIVRSDGSSMRLCWLGWTELGGVEKNVLTQLKVPHPTTWQPVAIEVNSAVFCVETDARGSITSLYDFTSGEIHEVYRYSAFGAVHVYGASLDERRSQATSPWLYCGKRRLIAAYDFGPRRYSEPCRRWLERDPLGLVDTIDDRIYARNDPVTFADSSGLFPWAIDWSEVGHSIVHVATRILRSAYKTITFSRERCDWLSEVRSAYEDLLFQLFGRTWLRCSGYNLDESASYVYGEGLERPKARITLINGILNGAPEATSSASLLSTTHGHVPVHFVYAATAGFSGDMLRGALAKAGVASHQAQLLANLWRELIGEMGGVEGGGTIFHYAHSLGAIDTLNALQLMAPQERALIRCATFGSPALLEDGICAKVDNYISVQDGVPLLDFQRYRDGMKGKRSNVHVIPSHSMPLVDHYFNGHTYAGVLEILGQKFQEEFLLQN